MIRRLVSSLSLVLAALVSPLTGLPLTTVDEDLGEATVPGALASLDVAVVVPLTPPVERDAILSANALSSLTDETGALTRQLDALDGSPATIGLDPRIPASIRLLGSDAPGSAVSWLDRLEELPNEVFLLGYADADPVVLSQALGAPALEPRAFDFAIDPELFRRAPTVTSTPSPTTTTPSPTSTPGPTSAAGPRTAPDPPETGEPEDEHGDPSVEQPSPLPADPPTDPAEPEVPAIPTTRTLLGWGADITGLVWPGDDTVVRDDLELLIAGGAETVLLTSDNVDREGPHLDLGELGALVSDAELSTVFRDAVLARTTIDADSAEQDLTELVAATAAQSDRARVITLDRDWAVGGLRLAEALDAVSTAAETRFVTLAEVLDSPSERGSIVDRPQSEERLEASRRIVAALERERNFAPILLDQEELLGPRTLMALQLFSVGWLGRDQLWSSSVEGFLDVSDTLLGSVQIVESELESLVLASRTELPVSVSNALGAPVTVFVEVRSRLPSLRIEEQLVELQLGPNSTSRALIPVESVANGRVVVDVTLRNAAGEQLGEAKDMILDFQAGWETAGTVIAAALVVALFLFGIVRNVLRRRRDSDNDAASADG